MMSTQTHTNLQKIHKKTRIRNRVFAAPDRTASQHGRARRLAAPFVCALALTATSACAPVINPVSIASTLLDGMSYAATGKSGTDHVISRVADKDCAVHRKFKGEAVCRDADGAGDPAEAGLADTADPDAPEAGLGFR